MSHSDHVVNHQVDYTSPRQHAKPQAGPTGCFKFAALGGLAVFGGFGLMVFLFIFGIISIIGGGSELSAIGEESQYAEFTVAGDRGSDNIIAVIDIEGVILMGGAGSRNEICSATAVQRLIKHIKKSGDIKAVLLNINSPGGEVVASDLIYNAIKTMKEELDIPVVSYMQTVAASGGYYIACASDYIMAHRMTTTGSIGVIINSVNYEELFTKIGVKSEVYKSGELKDMLNGARARTEKEALYIQSIVDETYDEFLSIVAEGRKLEKSAIRSSDAGDARIVSGKEAVRLKLVDELGFFDDAVAKVAEMANISNDYVATRYVRPFNFMEFMQSVKSDAGSVDVSIGGSSTRAFTPSPGKPYYLAEGLY